MVSGVLGLGPYTSRQDYQSLNFLKQLKKHKKIDKEVFSIYTGLEEGKKSHMKLGGWDKNGMAPGEDLFMVQTVNSSSWAIRFDHFEIQNH